MIFAGQNTEYIFKITFELLRLAKLINLQERTNLESELKQSNKIKRDLHPPCYFDL